MIDSERSALAPAGVSRRAFVGGMAAAGAGLPFASIGEVFAIPKLVRRAVPSSGETLGIIGLGTWQAFDIGDGADEQAARGDVLKALSLGGGSVVDSSPMYGRSEAVLGGLAGELDLRDSLFFATKIWTRGREAGVEQMRRSASHFGVDRIDLVQIHNLLDWRVHAETLAQWKAEGRLRYTGLTHYVASAYNELARAMQKMRPDFVQINYSVAEPEAADRLLPMAADLGVAVLVNRPFAGGAVFAQSRGHALPEWAAQWQCESFGQLYLKYILAHPSVTCAIPGTAKVAHMQDNLGAGMGPVPDAAGAERIARFFATL